MSSELNLLLSVKEVRGSDTEASVASCVKVERGLSLILTHTISVLIKVQQLYKHQITMFYYNDVYITPVYITLIFVPHNVCT